MLVEKVQSMTFFELVLCYFLSKQTHVISLLRISENNVCYIIKKIWKLLGHNVATLVQTWTITIA